MRFIDSQPATLRTRCGRRFGLTEVKRKWPGLMSRSDGDPHTATRRRPGRQSERYRTAKGACGGIGRSANSASSSASRQQSLNSRERLGGVDVGRGWLRHGCECVRVCLARLQADANRREARLVLFENRPREARASKKKGVIHYALGRRRRGCYWLRLVIATVFNGLCDCRSRPLKTASVSDKPIETCFSDGESHIIIAGNPPEQTMLTTTSTAHRVCTISTTRP